jgi:phage repressor protein C with HTH and peptisase S24 domain
MTENLDSIGGRVRWRMKQIGLDQPAMSERVGISQSAISQILSGKVGSSRHLPQIAAALSVNLNWLIGATDQLIDMLDENGDEISEDDLRIRAMQIPPTAEMIADKLDSIMIPEIDISYSMGGGSVIADHHSGHMRPFPREWLRPLIKGGFDEVFIARGEGDSMQPTLLDGDIVIVDTAQKSVDRQDRLWALAYGDLGMIKRVRKLHDGGYQINSDNAAVSPFTVYDDEMHIVGRVIWIGRNV